MHGLLIVLNECASLWQVKRPESLFDVRESAMTTRDADGSNRLLRNAFRLSDDQQAVLDQADRFARDELAPLQARMDDEEWWPPQVMPALARMGFLGVTVDPELGGAGSDFFTAGPITQGLARWNPAVALSYAAHENLCLNNIARNGNDEIKRRYLPKLCDGTATGALGLTEPGAGSDALGSMATQARRRALLPQRPRISSAIWMRGLPLS
jgi:isovaleryl-CoA dehydrogenase